MKRIVLIFTLLILCLACLCSCDLFTKPCEHSEVIDAAVAPTCTETGLTEGKHCSICGEVTLAQQTVAPLGHTEIIEEAKAATCTEDGLTTGVHCSVCKVTIIEQQVVPAAHTYGEWEQVSEPDCFFEGERKRVCSVCSRVDSEATARVEHSFVKNEESGLFTCEKCNSRIYNGHLYGIIDLSTTWYEAYEICESIGGHLVTITDEGEQALVTDMISNAVHHIYWMGAYRNTDGWRWITSEKFEYTKWHYRKPDNAGSIEWYLNIYAEKANEPLGEWNDLDANKTRAASYTSGIICEWDLDIEESEHYFTEWQTVTEVSCFADGEEYRICTHCGLEETKKLDQLKHNFVFNEATGVNSCEHCSAAMYDGRIYMIFTGSASWFDAAEKCMALGGHLVTITSESEQTFINTYMNSRSFRDRTWIGGYYDGAKFNWVTDEAFEYTNWHRGDPNFTGGSQFFVSLNYSTLGQWTDDDPQNANFAYICEWEA